MLSFRDIKLDLNKKIRASLRVIWGIGHYKSEIFCSKIGLSSSFFLGNINDYNWDILFNLMSDYLKSEASIKRSVQMKIRFLVDSKSYKGLRYLKGLPVNGQRTRTNAKSFKRLSLVNRS